LRHRGGVPNRAATITATFDDGRRAANGRRRYSPGVLFKEDVMALDPDFLSILRCPASKKPLFVDGDRLVADDPSGRRSYPLDGGDLPVLVFDEATKLSEEEWKAAKTRSKGGAS
jgi:uncharacterized protein YbaR (Trm112 family)